MFLSQEISLLENRLYYEGGLSGVLLDNETRSMNLSTAVIQSTGDGPNNQQSPRLMPTNQPQQVRL